jgi:hypothetical protein
MRRSALGIAWLMTVAVGCGGGDPHHDAGPIACTSDRQCSGAGLVCDLTRAMCVECVATSDCMAGQACRQASCVTVVPCMSSRTCPGQVCDTTLHYCVDCVSDVDCRNGQVCRVGSCVAPPAPCTSDRQCSAMGLVCDVAGHVCVECNGAIDCAPGMVCSSAHVCAPTMGDASHPSDAAVVSDAGPPFVIATHGAAPIVPDQGGPRMAHPELVVITYADDPYRSIEEAHASWLVTSSWLTSVGQEYGIGAGAILGTVHLGNAPASTSDRDIESFLGSGIASRSLPRSADGTLGNVVYVVYFPEQTLVTWSANGSTSCSSFDGFHNSATTSGGETFTYAVINSCAGSDPTLTLVENSEVTVAHEVIEAATDAQPLATPAFELMRTDSSPWLLVGGELADLCALRVGPWAYPRYGSFVTALVWSNAAARANDRDPCIPEDASAPYDSVAVTPSTLQPIQPGGSVTFDLAGWSTARVPTWQVTATPAPASATMFMPSVSIDHASMNNGDHATLTVFAPPSAGSQTYALIYVAISVSGSTNADAVPVGVFVP